MDTRATTEERIAQLKRERDEIQSDPTAAQFVKNAQLKMVDREIATLQNLAK